MGNDFNKSVGRKLYMARKAKGYSRAKVGQLVGLHETTVKRYEDGDIKSLDIERLKAFAVALGTSAAELIGWMYADEATDDELEFMFSASEQQSNGQLDAKRAMFDAFGKNGSVCDISAFDGTIALLIYKTMSRSCYDALLPTLQLTKELKPKDLERIYTLISRYLYADKSLQRLIDAALERHEDINTELVQR